MVGLVLQKSHINTKDECHYVALVAELEARGAKVKKRVFEVFDTACIRFPAGLLYCNDRGVSGLSTF